MLYLKLLLTKLSIDDCHWCIIKCSSEVYIKCCWSISIIFFGSDNKNLVLQNKWLSNKSNHYLQMKISNPKMMNSLVHRIPWIILYSFGKAYTCSILFISKSSLQFRHRFSCHSNATCDWKISCIWCTIALKIQIVFDWHLKSMCKYASLIHLYLAIKPSYLLLYSKK